MTESQIIKLENSKAKFFYITNGPYYRPGASGYTSRITEAGLFTKEEAISHARHCEDLTIHPG